MNTLLKTKYFALPLLSLTLVLSGCMATQSVVYDHNLDIKTKMSNSVFLDPVPASQKTIYLETHNTSDQQNIDVRSPLTADLQAKGYRLVSNASAAHYVLQVNVLSAGQYKPDGASKMADGAVTGGALGLGAGALVNNHTSGLVTGAVAGALVGMIADSAFQTISYHLVTDVQVAERVNGQVNVTSKQKLVGPSTITSTSSQTSSQWNKSQTQIASVATKTNLKFEAAAPQLAQAMAQSIAGIFG